jgi:hypothetical protein
MDKGVYGSVNDAVDSLVEIKVGPEEVYIFHRKETKEVLAIVFGQVLDPTYIKTASEYIGKVFAIIETDTKLKQMVTDTVLRTCKESVGEAEMEEERIRTILKLGAHNFEFNSQKKEDNPKEYRMWKKFEEANEMGKERVLQMRMANALLKDGLAGMKERLREYMPTQCDQLSKFAKTHWDRANKEASQMVEMPLQELFGTVWLSLHNTDYHIDSCMVDKVMSGCLYLGGFKEKRHFSLLDFGCIFRHSAGSAVFFHPGIIHGSSSEAVRSNQLALVLAFFNDMRRHTKN